MVMKYMYLRIFDYVIEGTKIITLTERIRIIRTYNGNR